MSRLEDSHIRLIVLEVLKQNRLIDGLVPIPLAESRLGEDVRRIVREESDVYRELAAMGKLPPYPCGLCGSRESHSHVGEARPVVVNLSGDSSAARSFVAEHVKQVLAEHVADQVAETFLPIVEALIWAHPDWTRQALIRETKAILRDLKASDD